MNGERLVITTWGLLVALVVSSLPWVWRRWHRVSFGVRTALALSIGLALPGVLLGLEAATRYFLCRCGGHGLMCSVFGEVEMPLLSGLVAASGVLGLLLWPISLLLWPWKHADLQLVRLFNGGVWFFANLLILVRFNGDWPPVPPFR